MSKPKIIIPKLALTLNAKRSPTSKPRPTSDPSLGVMPDIVQTVDRGELRQKKHNDVKVTKSNSVRLRGDASDVTDKIRRARSFSNSDKQRTDVVVTQKRVTSLSDLEAQEDDSGHSSCNESEIICVNVEDFARVDPKLRVRCQSLDALDTSLLTSPDTSLITSPDTSTGLQNNTASNSGSTLVNDESSTATLQDIQERTTDLLERLSTVTTTSTTQQKLDPPSKRGLTNSQSDQLISDLYKGEERRAINRSVTSDGKVTLRSASADGFGKLKGILKNKNWREGVRERVTFATRCDDCDQYVRFVNDSGAFSYSSLVFCPTLPYTHPDPCNSKIRKFVV